MENNMLTTRAAKFIAGMKNELNSEKFRKFLLKETYRRPKPSVLPILRSIFEHEEEDEVILQLMYLKGHLKKSHEEYMAEHRKDVNLMKRIDILLKNLKEEQKAEGRQGRKQMSMAGYLKEKN